ncbi:MAG: TIGR03620 family F420-dependent LLM class oxidoreductase [Candidatus Binataceae bacterium]|jgi:probable F420-dependent oxidoreductase
MDIGALGVFGYLDTMTGSQAADYARAVERLGYSVLWFPETFGRDPFPLAVYLLGATSRLVVATGIANVWKREAIAMAGSARTVAELFDGRFILGLGVSGGPFMARNGLRFDKPVTFMREYLAKMRATQHKAPTAKHEPPIVIAALLPKMLRLAADETHGTVTAMIPPRQIARMRAEIGPDKWVCAQQHVMLETDAKKARAAARAFLHFYLSAPPYQRSLRAMGFTDDDLANDGSDRLIDEIIAWGDERVLRERLEAHRKAGANHVFITPLNPDGGLSPGMRAVEALAPHHGG